VICNVSNYDDHLWCHITLVAKVVDVCVRKMWNSLLFFLLWKVFSYFHQTFSIAALWVKVESSSFVSKGQSWVKHAVPSVLWCSNSKAIQPIKNLLLQSQEVLSWVSSLTWILVPCTSELVGSQPVSDEVSPPFPVQEQCWVFSLPQCGSSDFNSFLDVVHPSFSRPASGPGGVWFPFQPSLCGPTGWHSSYVPVPSQLCLLDEV